MQSIALPNGRSICGQPSMPQRRLPTELPRRTPFGIFVSLIEMTNVAVERVLVFEVGDLVCAVPAGVTREVISPVAITRLPGVSDVVDGLINIRGTLLTVIDGHRLLGRPANPDHEGAIVVLEVFDRVCGLRVGRLVDLVAVPADAVDGRDTLPGVDPGIVKAVGRHQDSPFVLLDLEELLRPVMGT
ncbi:MAG: hypothetical protein E2O47_07050 [Gemmatimonadetes bacterium]|nr:MAG: hypothetical protein E2O47_07050 [Gemmatimonadota bacterium]